MKASSINFDSAPPIYLPFAFFLLANLCACSGLILLLNFDMSFHEASPIRSAITHILTIGFFLLIMLGALIQVLPIVIGQNIKQQKPVSLLTLSLLVIGVSVMTTAFIDNISLLLPAVCIITFSVIIYLAASASRVGFRLSLSASQLAILLALLSLFSVVILGLANALLYFYPSLNFGYWPIDLQTSKTLHLAWALLAWIPLLIMGVGYQVIPMFHVTPSFNERQSKIAPTVLLLSVVGITITRSPLFYIGVSLVLFWFALTTFRLIKNKKRKVFDTTASFWLLSSICLGVSIVMFWLGEYADNSVAIYESGLIFLFGFAGSVITGMLHKICPFLVFMHLQRISMKPPFPIINAPTMQEILPKNLGKSQLILHINWLITLAFSYWSDTISTYLILSGLANYLHLACCIARCASVYWVRRKPATHT